MKLLLTVCVIWALLYTAESLNCHVCANESCTNTTSVQCPATMTVCRTAYSVSGNSSFPTERVNKNCSSTLTCFTPLNTEAEVSVNNGLLREAHTQICCGTDNCNFQTLARPSSKINGKVCPACASLVDSLAGTCNATMNCLGAENSCFSGNITVNSTEALVRGCISKNLCSVEATILQQFTDSVSIKCGAPWSVSISAMLVTFALSSHKFLV